MVRAVFSFESGNYGKLITFGHKNNNLLKELPQLLKFTVTSVYQKADNEVCRKAQNLSASRVGVNVVVWRQSKNYCIILEILAHQPISYFRIVDS